MAVSLRNLRILQIFPLGPIISFSEQEVIGLKSLSLVSYSAVHWKNSFFEKELEVAYSYLNMIELGKSNGGPALLC